MNLQSKKKFWIMARLLMFIIGFQTLIFTVAWANNTSAQDLQNTSIDCRWDNVLLEQVFKEIELQSTFFFTYDRAVLDKISISGNNEQLKLIDLLVFLSGKTGLHFTIRNSNIIVHKGYNGFAKQTRLLIPDSDMLPDVLKKLDDTVLIEDLDGTEQEDDVINGNVSTETGEPLAGATIRLKGTQKGTITDADGNFSIVVPDAESAILIVEYLGYRVANIAVSGRPELSIVLTQANIDIETVVVEGIRESLASALELKNKSVNIKDAIVAEDIAKFPQANMAEALQRISGVQIRREYEGGVGNEVSVRGMPPEYTQVTIDGVPSTNNGNNRTFSFNSLPSELFQIAEVVKSPTAKMDEGGLAATVNLRTLKPFDASKRILVANLEGQYNSFDQKVSPKATFVIGDTWNNTFGALLGVSYNNFRRGAEAYDAVRWTKHDYDIDGDGVDDHKNVWLMDLPRYVVQPQEVKRLSLHPSFQYKPTKNFTLTLDGLYNNFDRKQDRYTALWFFNNAKNLQNMTVINNIVEQASFSDVKLLLENQTQDNKTNFLQGGLTGEWNLDDWDISAKTSLSNNDNDSERFRYYAGRTDQAEYDIRRDHRYWDLNTPVDLSNPDLFSMDEARKYVWDNSDKKYSGQFDVTKYSDSWISAIHFGAKYGDRSKNRRYRYNRIKNIGDPFGPVSATYDGFLDNVDEANAPTSFAIHDWDKAKEKYGNSIAFDDVERKQDRYDIGEGVASTYAMADILLGQFDANIGLRYSTTSVTSVGLQRDKNTGTYTERETKSNYSDLLPSLNARLKLAEDKLFLRTAFARVLTRPSLTDLSAYREVDEVNKRISAKNPDLDPFRANQYDFAVEWYPQKEMMLSGSLFHKDIESFIVTEEKSVQYNGETYTLKQPVNGNSATITGFELNFQTPFTFLPAPFDGLGTVLNYTYSDTSFEEELDNGEINKYSMPNHSKDSYNIIGYYDKNNLMVSLAHNFRGKFLRSKPNPEDGLKYRDDYGQTDLSSSYLIKDKFGISFNVVNLLNNKRYEYIFNERLMDTYFNFGRTYQIGLRYSF